MKRFSWLIALFTAIIFASCSSDSRVIVEIPELTEGQVLITYEDPLSMGQNIQKIAESELKDGKFEYTFTDPQFEKGKKSKLYSLSIKNQNMQFACQVPLPIEKNTTTSLKITDVNSYLRQSKPLNISFDGSKKLKRFSKFWDDISNSFVELARTDNSQKVFQAQTQIYKDYLKDYPHTEAMYALLISEVRSIRDDNNPIVQYAKSLSAEQTDNIWQQALVSYMKYRDAQSVLASTLVFSAQTVDGDTITERNFLGKYVLIDFWASWCKPCLQAIPTLEKIYKEYHPKGLEIVSISVDTNPNDWLDYAETKHFKWYNLWGNGEEMTHRYGFQYIPYLMLVDKQGKVITTEQSAEKMQEIIPKHIK